MRIDRKRNKQRILNEAAELFSATDVDAVPIDEIARCAGVTRATVYNHFEGRAEIVVALVQPTLEFSVSRMEQIHDQSSVSLEDITSSLFELYARYRGVMELIGCSYAAESPVIRKLHRRYLRLLREAFQRIDAATPLPLGLDGSINLLGETYLGVLRLLDRGELPADDRAGRFNDIMKGALLL